MKNVTEFLKEELSMPVNEAFESDIIRDIHDNMVKGHQNWWKDISKSYAWDKMTDADLVEMTPEEGKKKAYKRTETNTMLWIDSQNNLIGVTVGNFKWNCAWSNYGKMKSIMPIIRDSMTCYQILDADKFETSTLRKERQEARNNALALKDAQQVKRENIERYAKILREKTVKGMGEQLAEIQARMGEATKLYTAFLDECASNMDENISKYLKDAKNANDEFQRVLNIFDHLEWAKGYAEKNTSEWSYMDLIDSVKKFNKQMERFIGFYGQAKD